MTRGMQRMLRMLGETSTAVVTVADELGVDSEEFYRTAREGRPPSLALRCIVEHWSEGRIAFRDWDLPAEVAS